MSTIDPDSPPFGNGAANYGATEASYDTTTTTGTTGTSGASGTSGAVDTAKEAVGTAKEQAGSVAGDAKQAAGDVLSTGKQEAANVAHEAKVQVKDLLDQSRGQLTEQAHAQKDNAAKGVRAFSDDLTSLAKGEGGSNAATNLVSQLADRAQGVASWLEDREPAELLEDVKSFARRRPGAFILIAAATGLVGGRLLRALTAEAKDEKEATASTSGPEYSAPAASSVDTAYVDSPFVDDTYTGTTGSSSLERDHLPTVPVADPLSTPPTSTGYDTFPGGSRP
ncbi:hypothetical protein [Rathayibacter sp. Leaf296]|uniref:hypothetical protein n=1 Tax=Rathayibacter sp. Leaf296 TaxID=1736327 RepID=UPI000703495E|nr:hypothetical protein [Rathayibacter sp. Leaf296]KQQ07313.1 hypothetical protein ASF46_16680 [Rathayibacter sp. Leaf296]